MHAAPPTPMTPSAFAALLRPVNSALAEQAERILADAERDPASAPEHAQRLGGILARDVQVHDEPYGLAWVNGRGEHVLVTLPAPTPPEPEPELEPVGAVSETAPQPEPKTELEPEPAAEPVGVQVAEGRDEPVTAGSFFRSTGRLAQHGALTIVLAREGGSDEDPSLRVTLIPSAGSDDTKAYAQPFSVVANASELDEGFLRLIDTAVEGNRGIDSALEELKAAKAAEKAAQKAAADALKKKNARKTKPTAASGAKTTPTPEPTSTAEPAAPAEPTLFGAT